MSSALEIDKTRFLDIPFFVSYCNGSNPNDQTVHNDPFTKELLEALKKENLIKPLDVELDEAGNVVEECYSPFQIFIPLVFHKNIVDKDGNLRANWELDWQMENKQRSIAWSNSTVVSVGTQGDGLDIWKIAQNFHDFVRLLHTLPYKNERVHPNRRRLFTTLPPLHFDFSSVTLELLSSYDLDIETLKNLRNTIGRHAFSVDPLIEWYEYVRKHPQVKKDLLCGDAAIAQRCYEICDLIGQMIEKATGIKPPSLPRSTEMITPWGRGVGYDYVLGDDTWALGYALKSFKKWIEHPGRREKVIELDIGRIKQLEDDLDDYIKRYGHRSWTGNMITIHPEPDIKAQDLDQDSKKWLEISRQQVMAQQHDPDDVFDEAAEIGRLIHSRLSDIQRDLRRILWDIGEPWKDESHRLWEESEKVWDLVWRVEHESGKTMTMEEKIRFTQEKLGELSRRRAEIEELEKSLADEVGKFTEVVFCKVCHELPVEVHIDDLDRSSSQWGVQSVICDNCKDIAKDIHRLEELPAGFRCSGCDKTIFSYIHDNHFYATERAELNAAQKKAVLEKRKKKEKDVIIRHRRSIEIVYGRVHAVIVCGYCDTQNYYQVDYGWRE